ncbi:GNAT family N-acetyltransferase [Siminovitchia sp. 179-K 8D1 HS]|uniref:GNAT family N-acetyltransferase n=1 Tax=Siminovitchia sp. 179-K 8D1 HS TaxID=3142385 RepID=UPI00399FFC4B
MDIHNKETITLDFYKKDYYTKLSEYELSEEQSVYASLPLKGISECEKDPGKYPIVILYHREPAGFLILDEGEGVRAYSTNKDAILIRSYSVNKEFQGKGIAIESLRMLDSFVKKHFPSKKEIILAVNHKNIVAQHVYKRSGFIDKGMRVMGKKGELLVFHKSLK